jgi:hypothetical protein
VEEAGAGAEPPLKRKRMRLEKPAASARVVGALQERLGAVKKEQVKVMAASHSELRASVDAKVKAAVKEALAQVATSCVVGVAMSLEVLHSVLFIISCYCKLLYMINRDRNTDWIL